MSIEVFRVRLRTNSRPLAANETWSQGWQDTYGNEHGHRRVRVDIWADKAGTLYLDQTDNEDYSGVSSTTVSVSALTRAELAWVTISKRFYRVRYVNGGTANVKEPMILLERSAMSTADNSLAGVAQDGTDATGVTPPTGAVGIRGWLSGIYNLLFGGGAKVTVTGRSLSLQEINASSSTGGGAGTTTVTLVYAPAGKMARVKEIGIWIPAPVGATTGTHRLMIGHNVLVNGGVTNTSVLDSQAAAYNTVVGLFKPTAWQTVVAGQFPTDYPGFAKAKEQLVFTATVPLRVMYVNSTDAAQAASREVRLLCELEAIS